MRLQMGVKTVTRSKGLWGSISSPRPCSLPRLRNEAPQQSGLPGPTPLRLARAATEGSFDGAN